MWYVLHPSQSNHFTHPIAVGTGTWILDCARSWRVRVYIQCPRFVPLTDISPSELSLCWYGYPTPHLPRFLIHEYQVSTLSRFTQIFNVLVHLIWPQESHGYKQICSHLLKFLVPVLPRLISCILRSLDGLPFPNEEFDFVQVLILPCPTTVNNPV